jgi:class 3 adenylate cyclase
MSTEGHCFRIDFKIEVISMDEESGEFEFHLIPDPERYERIIFSGENGWLDKLDQSFISDEQMENLAASLAHKPIYASFPVIEDADEYVELRRKAIFQSFVEESEPYEFRDTSEELLARLDREKQRFVVIYCDLTGSTELSQAISPEQNARIISVFSREIAQLAPLFHAYVLKFIGDGATLYLPEPNFIGKNDLALDCSLAIRKLVLDAINPVLKSRKLPTLGIKIGIDSGEAVVTTVGSPVSKSHKDLIGETVNLAAKIQSLADTNQILVGQSTAENVHTMWRRHLHRIEPGEEWKYRDRKSGQVYTVYSLDW